MDLPQLSESALPRLPRVFAAIDFETSHHAPDSACAVGLVRVENGRIVRRVRQLLRPPPRAFLFTQIHGIRREDVENKPTFAEAWPVLAETIDGAEFLAAHNASFDRGVLHACCVSAGLPIPGVEFRCTVRLARRFFGIHPATLDNVCRELEIPLLHHHDALADAEACARIVIESLRRVAGGA